MRTQSNQIKSNQTKPIQIKSNQFNSIQFKSNQINLCWRHLGNTSIMISTILDIAIVPFRLYPAKLYYYETAEILYSRCDNRGHSAHKFIHFHFFNLADSAQPCFYIVRS